MRRSRRHEDLSLGSVSGWIANLTASWPNLGRMEDARASLEPFQRLEEEESQERQRAAEVLVQKKP